MQGDGRESLSAGNAGESWYPTMVGRMMKTSWEGLCKPSQAVSYICDGKEGTRLDHGTLLCLYVR